MELRRLLGGQLRHPLHRRLDGPRGTAKADKETIVETLLAISKMLVECPEIKELDMNPVLVYEKGARAVDARVIL